MRVDFYLLSEETEAVPFLCRLIEKAYHAGHRLCVYASNQAEAETLDEQLWTFRADAFVPHHLCGEGPTPPPPVHITFEGTPCAHDDILINLSPTIPDFFKTFKRVIEVVPANTEQREQSRAHYKSYRASGITPQMIDLTKRRVAS